MSYSGVSGLVDTSNHSIYLALGGNRVGRSKAYPLQQCEPPGQYDTRVKNEEFLRARESDHCLPHPKEGLLSLRTRPGAPKSILRVSKV